MSDSDGRHRVGDVADFPTGSSTVVEVAGDPIAVVHAEDGELYALTNVCPHSGGPLGDGKVEGDSIYCPWHGYQFELETGAHAQGLPLEAETYGVEVDGGQVFVRR